tara:strand:+ start:153 stop:596 length:444 start_codon:yes stop_codon:yes gene_type:complete
MSKRLSFKGLIPDGLQQVIRLRTLKGKKGYRIKKFQIIGQNPGTEVREFLAQVYSKDQTGVMTAVIDFSAGDLMGVAYMAQTSSVDSKPTTILFDNEVTNQDIYVTATDVSGNAGSTNFYLELEVIDLTPTQATQLTLKSLREVSSR